jgi:hypothetical protein
MSVRRSAKWLRDLLIAIRFENFFPVSFQSPIV